MITMMSKEEGFLKYIHERYKGKIHRMERVFNPNTFDHMSVVVEFRIPTHEVADELEMYRRINKVIHVIAEGDDDR